MTKARDQAAAKKLRGTPRVAQLVDYMSSPERLGLWRQNVQAAAFLAAVAVLAGREPVTLDPRGRAEHKLVEIGNYYSLTPETISDIKELAAFQFFFSEGTTIDAVLNAEMPGLLEAGADELEPILRGTDPVPRLLEHLQRLVSGAAGA